MSFRRSLLLVLTLLAPIPAARAQRVAVDLSIGHSGEHDRTAVSFLAQLPGGLFHLAAGLRGTRYRGDPVGFPRRDGDPEGPAGETVIPVDAWSANLMVEAGIALLPLVTLGFNLDLAGIAWGSTATIAGGVEASPASPSSFRYGNADRGSLNSEVFLAAGLGRLVRVRGGLSHYVVGYDVTGPGGTSRTNRFFNALFVAVRLGL